MKSVPFIFIVSALFSFIFVELFRRLALRLNFVEKKRKIPLIGGIGFSLAFIIAYFLSVNFYSVLVSSQLAWLLFFAFIVLAVEFLDDLREFPLSIRVILQVAIIAVFLINGKVTQIYFLPYWANYLVSFLWIMGVTNAFNHLDINDGLCGGISLIATLFFLVFAVVTADFGLIILFLALLGALFSFLLLNLPPAKVFMGNAGSHFLGFFFATISMYGDYATVENPFALILPIFILAFPVIDTFFIMLIRSAKGIFPLKKSDDHILQRLIFSGWSIKKALLKICIVSLLWGLSGILIYFGVNIYFIIVLAFAVFMSARIILSAVGR